MLTPKTAIWKWVANRSRAVQVELDVLFWKLRHFQSPGPAEIPVNCQSWPFYTEVIPSTALICMRTEQIPARITITITLQTTEGLYMQIGGIVLNGQPLLLPAPGAKWKRFEPNWYFTASRSVSLIRKSFCVLGLDVERELYAINRVCFRVIWCLRGNFMFTVSTFRELVFRASSTSARLKISAPKLYPPTRFCDHHTTTLNLHGFPACFNSHHHILNGCVSNVDSWTRQRWVVKGQDRQLIFPI